MAERLNRDALGGHKVSANQIQLKDYEPLSLFLVCSFGSLGVSRSLVERPWVWWLPGGSWSTGACALASNTGQNFESFPRIAKDNAAPPHPPTHHCKNEANKTMTTTRTAGIPFHSPPLFS